MMPERVARFLPLICLDPRACAAVSSNRRKTQKEVLKDLLLELPIETSGYLPLQCFEEFGVFDSFPLQPR